MSKYRLLDIQKETISPVWLQGVNLEENGNMYFFLLCLDYISMKSTELDCTLFS